MEIRVISVKEEERTKTSNKLMPFISIWPFTFFLAAVVVVCLHNSADLFLARLLSFSAR